MGSDKAFLEIDGIPLAARVAREIGKVCGSVTLLGDPARYGVAGTAGPAGRICRRRAAGGNRNGAAAHGCGLESGGRLRHARAGGGEFWKLFSAAAEAGASNGAIPRYRDGKIEPLCAVYHRRCHRGMSGARSEAGVRKVTDALQTLELTYVRSGNQRAPFANLNTPRGSPDTIRMAEQFPHYIEFRHVYKTFDKPVLVDSNFYVDSGQTVAIIGRSGVGKSVSLGHIMGFLKPDQGRVIVAHEDITDLSEAELNRIRRKVTMVFPVGRAVRFADGGGEYPVLAGTAGRLRRGQQRRRGGGAAEDGRDLGIAAMRFRRTCPPDTGAPSRLRGRWRRNPSASFTTSPPPWWTRL